MRFERAITLAGIDAHPLRAPAADGPTMALGRMPTRPALLARVVDRDGVAGWGEVWANFPPRANLHKAHLLEDVIAARLDGFTFTAPVEVTEYLREALATYFLHAGQSRVFEHLLAGLDCALWDLALRAAGSSFADAAPADWARLARATVIPLAAGENLYGADEFLRATAAGVAIVQPDVAKWGGITGALVLAEALPAGARLWPHFMGGAVGQVAALSVAAAVESMLECGDGDGDESVCELDVNPNPLRDALCGDLFTVTDGRIVLPNAPGLTPPPLVERLAEYRDTDV